MAAKHILNRSWTLKIGLKRKNKKRRKKKRKKEFKETGRKEKENERESERDRDTSMCPMGLKKKKLLQFKLNPYIEILTQHAGGRQRSCDTDLLACGGRAKSFTYLQALKLPISAAVGGRIS